MNKTKQLLAVLSLVPAVCMAQSNTENYVKTTTVLEADGTGSVSAVQYYNGLGCPTVVVANADSHGGTAAVLTTYDALGREERKYLPVPGNGLGIVDEEYVQAQAGFYQDNSGFTQNHYDALGRVTAVDMAGDGWREAGKQVRTEHSYNAADEVRIYKTAPGLHDTGKYYPAGSLTKETVSDADDKTVITFRNLFGNVVLRRANDGTDFLDTYYVYDELGQLRYVLTPQCQTDGIKAINYYEYRYDNMGMLRTKILPGCKEIRYWYDKAGRLSYVKHPALGGRYRFYLYDKFGRLCVQGTCSGGTRDSTRLSTTSYASGTGNGLCQTGYAAPYTISAPQPEIVNYYDSYGFKDKQQKTNMPAVPVTPQQEQCSVGSLTGTLVYATDGESLGTVNVYDRKGQVIRTVRKGLGGYVEDVATAYTFTGAVDKTTAKVNVKYGGEDFTAITDYDYSYGKKATMTLSVSHGLPAVARATAYDYDAIGRLTGKQRQLVGTSHSDCAYSYDVHGWLKSISSGGFQEYLYYADGVDTARYYNGNISSYRWKHRNDNDTSSKGYVLKYDGCNRLREAVFGQGNDLSSYRDFFSEQVEEYDRNGNILRLKRRGLTDSRHGGFGLVDDLYMTYSGNRLTSVRDGATHDAYNGVTDFYTDSKQKSYPLTYNDAGSLVSDAGRKIAKIEYDDNNNPVRIQFTDGSVTRYVYSATGEKLRTVHQTAVPNVSVPLGNSRELKPSEIQHADSTDYLLGGILTLRNGRIDKYQFEEGYCQASRRSATQDSFIFLYYDRDHLGNIRQVTKDDGTQGGSVIQRMDYYPFGAEFCVNSIKSYVQLHKYNGKEFDNMHGLNTYDYGARQYNPVTARWDRVDQLSEKYYSISPYVYCANNPVNAFDPDGRIIILRFRYKDGKLRDYPFNPQKQQTIPDHYFVHDFVSAYSYNIENGGGDNMFKAANDPNREYIVIDANVYWEGQKRRTEYLPEYGERRIKWESRRGLRFDGDKRQSPATRLEHEFDHAVDDSANGTEHRLRRKEPDGQYGNKEERRVIEGSEKKTSLANGEDVRSHHLGKTFKTKNSISTEEEFDL